MNRKVLPFLKLGVTPFQVQTPSKYYSSEHFVHACASFVFCVFRTASSAYFLVLGNVSARMKNFLWKIAAQLILVVV